MASLSKPPSQSHLTTRISLRWLPEPPFETTDTIVLQVGEWYVDLRVDKQTGGMDWAIAGQCLLENENPRRVIFTHEIDSHHNFNLSGSCPFIPLPNGDELETGTMRCPDKPGTPMTDYEEVWRYLPLCKVPGGSESGISWVLESHDGDLGEGQFQITKTFLGRIGGTYLVLHQGQTHVRSQSSQGEWAVKITGGEVSARREEWVDNHWEEKYVLGPNSRDLPSMFKGYDGEGRGSWCKPGEQVNVGDHQYIVRAFEAWV